MGGGGEALLSEVRGGFLILFRFYKGKMLRCEDDLRIFVFQ